MAILTPEKVESPGISPETTTPMKPSEMIRLGTMTTQQAFGYLFSEHGDACAIGAAWLGSGRPPVPVVDDWNEVYEWFDNLFGDKFHNCPGDKCSAGETLPELTWHLNDNHKWDRQRIADWLESKGY